MFSQGHLALRLVRVKPGEKWAGQANELWFIFPKAGEGQYVSPAVKHRLAPGDALFLKGGPEGGLIAAEGGELAFWFFSARLEHLYPLFASSEFSLLQNLAERLKAARRHDSASPLARECHKLLSEAPPRFGLVHRSQLLRVIGAILGAELKAVPSHQAGFDHAHEHMVQVFEKLSADELLGLPVGELAARFGCSRRQLSRFFQQHFGFSAAAMRMEMRLLKAVTLLRDPAAKVISIAEQCGFNHLGLFNTCFKRRFEASPSQYRKSMVEAHVSSDRPNPTSPVCPLRSSGFCPWVADGHDAPSGTSRGLKSKPSARQHSSASTVPPGAVIPDGRSMARDVHNLPSILIDDATAFQEFMEQL